MEGEVRQDLRLEDAEAVFQFFRYMADVERVGNENVVLPAAVRGNMAGMSEAKKSLAYCGNPWWERIWTVQEAVLPQALALQWGPLDAALGCTGRRLFDVGKGRLPQHHVGKAGVHRG